MLALFFKVLIPQNYHLTTIYKRALFVMFVFLGTVLCSDCEFIFIMKFI